MSFKKLGNPIWWWKPLIGYIWVNWRHTSNTLFPCVTLWENQEDNCENPQVWFISRSNFQMSICATFICANNYTQILISLECSSIIPLRKDAVLCPRDERALVWIACINSRTKEKRLVKMLLKLESHRKFLVRAEKQKK